MNLCVLMAAVVVLPVVVDSTACADCTSTYDTAVTNAGTDKTAKCTAAKAYITCLETDLATCSAADLKTKGGVADTAITDLGADCTVAATSTCQCERNAIKADVTGGDAAICSNAQAAIKCLRGTVNAGCSSSRAVAATAYAGLITSKCTATATCTCEIDHAKATVTAPADQCTAAKTLVKCVRESTDGGCVDTRVQVGTAAEGIIDTLGTTNCPKTSTCQCEIAHAKADVSSTDKVCSAAKALVNCLQPTKDAGCTETRVQVGTFAETKTKAATCVTTDVCDCEVAYGKADIADDTKQCTAINTKITCLKDKSNAGCDGSSYLMVAEASRKVLGGVANCAKSDTCTCETNYATADLSTKDKQCSKAKIAKECLQNITATETGCDGSSSPTQVITNYAQPLIDQYCGAASLTGVGLTVGILVMLLEITRRI